MTPHFGTYHWSKNIVYGCQNTVHGCKMEFDTPFLATPIGVALRVVGRFSPFNVHKWVLKLGLNNLEKLMYCAGNERL